MLSLVGSINQDLVARVARLPKPGETVRANSLDEIAGGKGANQAVAASRAGGHVAMIGRVGRDTFGPMLLANLSDERVHTEFVQQTSGPSGVAIINVDDDAENSIVIVPGANGRLTPEDVRAGSSAIAASQLLLLQLEVPIETVIAAIDVAKEARVPVLLDPAPAPRSFPQELLDVAYVCPNESEAETLTGIAVCDDASAFAAADRLRECGATAVLVTRGSQGVTLVTESVRTVVPAISVDAVDTTAAGDAFAGAFAVQIAEGTGIEQAVRFAAIAGALAVSKAGAQPSLPTRREIEARL